MVATGLTIWDLSDPRVGNHWDSSYQIAVCGRLLPSMGTTPGGIHTDGEGVIHIHPSGSAGAGANAILALLFANSIGKLTDSSLILPSGETYAGGDHCPGGEPSHLGVTVNGLSQKRARSLCDAQPRRDFC